MPPLSKRIKAEIVSDMEENCPNSMETVHHPQEENYEKEIRNLLNRIEELENQNKLKDDELSLKNQKIRELEEIVRTKSLHKCKANILNYSQLKKKSQASGGTYHEVDSQICKLEEQRILRWEDLENVNRMRNEKFLTNSKLTDSFVKKNPGVLASTSIEGRKIINSSLDRNSLKIQLFKIDRLLGDKKKVKGRKLEKIMRKLTPYEIGLENIKIKMEVEEIPDCKENKSKVADEFENISDLTFNANISQLNLDYQEMKNLPSISFLNKD